MPVTTAEAFLALLEKSRLVSPAQLTQARAVPGQDPQAIAQELIRQGQLTRWQAQQLLAGRHSFFLGKYKLLDKLGEGGMGAVYKAQQTTTGRMVAVKVMSENVVKQPGAVSRFHREIRAVSALHHPNIVAAFDADQVGETHFLVMEYAEGRDLKEWIKEYGKLPIDWSCECIRQAALGLQHAHERGLAHRDIKPSNLLVVSNDVGGIPQVKILDMGLARFTSETQCTVLTQTGQVLGTIDYISPEQAKDTKGAGIQADIFSLGASLFHMITGQVPFLGKSPMEKLMARAMRNAPRASSLSPALPPGLDEIIAKMLARKPDDRFQTPDEVVAVLEPFCLGATSDHSSSLTLPKSAAVTAGSTIEAEADQTLNHFLGTLESGPAEEEPIHVKGDEARLRPTIQRGPGFDPRRLKAKWIALAAALLLIGIGMLWWGSSGKPKQIDVPREPPLAVSPLDAKQAREVQDAWARHLGVQADLTNSIGMKFRLIPPGEFLMGTSSADLPRLLEMAKRNGEGWETTHIPAETPQHRVRIARPFFLGIYEVKNSQFQKFVAAGNGAEGWKPVGPSADPEMPAGGASYEQMTEFCKWLGERDQAIYRLPTEAEWEYACRAGTITPFAFGDSLSSTQANFNGEFPFGNGAKGPNRGVATKAGSFAANAWGLYDMHGNVWETCSDWYAADAYRNHAALDPMGPVTGTIHVTRGADYENSRGVAVRSATHFGYPLPYYSVGFRVVREVEQLATAQRKPPISGELSPYAVFTSPDYQWTAPENLGPVVNSLSDEGSPCLSADGLTLLFDSGRPGGHGHGDLWLCRRRTPTAPWSAPENLGATVNLQSSEMNPSLSADGLTLAFASDRGAPPNEFHLWMCTRATPGDPWSPVKKLDPSLDAAGASDAGPEQSADGLSLLFHSDGRPGLGGNDLWWCRRRTKADPWGTPENLGPTVNSKHEDVALALSSDGRVLVFASKRSDGKRKDLWWSSRPSLDAPWSAAQKFGAPVSSVFEANAPTLSADGRTMIFASYDRSGGQGKWDLWISRRVLKNSATGIAKTSAMDDPARWKHAINLLPLVNPAKDRVGGEWAIADGEIVCTKPATTATLEIPYQPAREYEFRIDFTVRSGTPQVNQFLARERTAWSFIMGAYNNTFVGFEMIDGRSVDENPTVRRQKLELGHRYTAVVRVSDTETAAWLDGVETARWKTNYGDLGLDHPRWKHWNRRDRSVLAIGALGSVVDFHQLAVLELTGRGVFTRPDDAAAKEADTKRSAAAEKYVNALGMEFVRVPKGRSWLGGGGGKPGTQEVAIAEDFYLGKFEVTQEEWEKVMGTNPSRFKVNQKRFPVEQVSWDDAQSFLGKLNARDKQAGWEYRLPTTLEWEYACRGGPLAKPEDSAFHFYFDPPTNTLAPVQANVLETVQLRRPCLVGSFPPNRLGLHDLHGNVREWCADARTGSDGSALRVFRYGGWTTSAVDCWAGKDGGTPPSAKDHDLGLRVARVPVANASPSVSLFNGKDLTGLTKTNPAHNTGMAEVVVDDGQPALRLTKPYGLATPAFGNYHLRFQTKNNSGVGGVYHVFAGGIGLYLRCEISGQSAALIVAGHGSTYQEAKLERKVEAGAYGGGLHLAGASSRFEFRLGNRSVSQVSGTNCTYQPAEIQAGRFVAVGKPLGDNTPFDLGKDSLGTVDSWQRIEVLRLGDSFALVVNGKPAGAFTNVRFLHDGKVLAPGPRQPITLWAFGGPISFRNLEFREIDSLPPELSSVSPN